MSSESTNQILIADKRLRRKVLGLAIVLSGLGLAAIYALEQFLQDIQELAKESPEEALEQFSAFLSVFLAVASLSLILASGWVAHFSLKALHTEQFPPPGTRVILDTRVIHGVQARRKAFLGLIFAAMLATCSVLLPWQGWNVYQVIEPDLAPQSCLSLKS